VHGKQVTFSGIVEDITNMNMRKCVLSGGKCHHIALSHMKFHCTKKYDAFGEDVDDDDDSNSESDYEENSDDDDDDDDDTVKCGNGIWQ